MKRLIEGKLYDTEKADLIFEKIVHPTPFFHRDERLFRTSKGAFFLALRDMWGDRIVPLADDQVATWLVARNAPEGVMALVAEHIEEA